MTVFLVLLFTHRPAPAADEREYRELELTSAGPTYTVTYSFWTDCAPDTLMQVFLDPVHVEACMRRGNLHMAVVDSTLLRNRIEYTYNYFIATLRLRFSRAADTLRNRMCFVLEACSTSGSTVVPSVRSSSGYYAVAPDSGGYRVDYWQQTTLDRNLTDFHLYFIRRDTRRVLHTQQRYVGERRWDRHAP
jgi:hypothetical protein